MGCQDTNQISGTFCRQSAYALQTITISNNRLYSCLALVLPRVVSNCACRISGSIPSRLMQMYPSLQALLISNNHISSSIPNLKRITEWNPIGVAAEVHTNKRKETRRKQVKGAIFKLVNDTAYLGGSCVINATSQCVTSPRFNPDGDFSGIVSYSVDSQGYPVSCST